VYTHLWFVQVLGVKNHEEALEIWRWNWEVNCWPDSEMLALRGHRPLVFTPISWETYYDNERGDFYFWISDLPRMHQMCIALAMSRHPRLGQWSDLGMIPGELLFKISFAYFHM
jgi:hypothetical protein